jgi:hypothetical protein
LESFQIAAARTHLILPGAPCGAQILLARVEVGTEELWAPGLGYRPQHRGEGRMSLSLYVHTLVPHIRLNVWTTDLEAAKHHSSTGQMHCNWRLS